MNEKELRVKVENMIASLREQIKQHVPENGNFPMVYSEFKIGDKDLCLTDVLLSFKAKPEYLPNSETVRWLELSGYKLPEPYKSSQIIFMGTKSETLEALEKPEIGEKICNVIHALDFNLRDV